MDQTTNDAPIATLPQHATERLAEMRGRGEAEPAVHQRPVHQRTSAGQGGRLRPGRPGRRQLHLPRRLPAVRLVAEPGDDRLDPGHVPRPRTGDGPHGGRGPPTRRGRHRRRPPGSQPQGVGQPHRRVRRHRHGHRPPQRPAPLQEQARPPVHLRPVRPGLLHPAAVRLPAPGHGHGQLRVPHRRPVVRQLHAERSARTPS